MTAKRSKAESGDVTPEAEISSSASGWIHWIFRDSLLEAMGPNYGTLEPPEFTRAETAADADRETSHGQGE